MRKVRHLFIIMFIYAVSLSSASYADIVTDYTFRLWGQETLTQIESDFGRWDGLYNQSITETFPSYAWGQGVMFRALVAASGIDLYYLNRAEEQADAFQNQFWCYTNSIWGYNAGANSCGDRYYDDNAWIALGLIELYEITNDSAYLDHARDVVAFCMSGENGPGDTPDGGIRWREIDTGGVSVCSTAPTCLANLMIYQDTGIEQYLTDGLRLYNWLVTSSGLQYSSGLFHEVNQGPLGYQTAVVLQAVLRLYQITSNEDYLTEAQRLAAAMENAFINNSTHALEQTGKWGGHDMTNAYVELYEVDHYQHWLDIVTWYLEFLHDNCKDTSSGRYPVNWSDTSGSSSAELIDNASVASAYWKMASTVVITAPVTLYQHCDYGGWLADFGVGAYTTSDIVAAGGLDNDASSVKISPGYTVTFYDNDNFQGATFTKTADDSCFVDEGWNDQISSMVIEAILDPVVYWKFNDTEDLIADDASEYHFDGTLTNMDTGDWVAGKQCSALSFDGVDDYVEIIGFKGISGDASRTCTAWIKTAVTDKQILSWGSYYDGGKWLILLDGDGYLRTSVNGGSIVGSSVLSDDQWHHIAVVLADDNSTDISEAKLYVDGALETISGSISEPVYTGIYQNVQIGMYNVGQRYFQGLIDEVRIYSRALSDAEIQDIYQEHVLIGDMEPDGDVDLEDFAVFANYWQNSDTCDGDLTCDCSVDIDDFMILADEWLSQVPSN